MCPSDQQRKDELSRLIQESEKKGQEIVKKSSDLVQFGQEVTDLAGASERVLKYVTPIGIDWEQKIHAWGYVNEQQDTILRSMMPISMASATTSGITANYAMTDFTMPDTIVRFVPPGKQDAARVAAQQLSSVIDRQAQKGRVLSLLRQYGLVSATPGQKSPAELFETAWAAFEKPVTQSLPASTSLIPMRDCINATIAALLRRRPTQERSKSQHDKILSICGQLAGNGVSQWAIQILAQHWERLVDELSSAKQSNYSREQWGDCLRRASLFLLEFLQSLERSKMK